VASKKRNRPFFTFLHSQKSVRNYWIVTLFRHFNIGRSRHSSDTHHSGTHITFKTKSRELSVRIWIGCDNLNSACRTNKCVFSKKSSFQNCLCDKLKGRVNLRFTLRFDLQFDLQFGACIGTCSASTQSILLHWRANAGTKSRKTCHLKCLVTAIPSQR
jgi:hypothetical protein